jgi:hypothetical protein
VVRRLILVAVLPAALLGVMTSGMLVRALFGSHPIWHADPVNLSEAAALRDQATVVQMIRRGEDPYLRREVRADLLFNDRMELTPLEAAIASGRAEVAEIILWSATPPAAAEWGRLRCLAQLGGDEDVIEVLDRYRRASEEIECTGVTRPWK